jgi:hypothetical protein
MSLHIGGKKEIAEKKILFILDYEQAMNNADSSMFLKNNCGSQEDIENTQTKKSIVVTETNGKIEIYYSPISSVTLAGRCRYEWTE